MIYKFRMISGDERVFLRDYEVDSNQTFLDLHKIIQDNLQYDSSQLASFFLADESWNKGLELTLIDMENDGGPAAIPMDSIKIKEVMKEKKERLLYVYDILTENSFFIELMDIYTPDCKKKYPICTVSVGEPPLQSEFENISTNPVNDDNSFNDIIDEFDSQEFDYGSEGFDGDDS
ncbi:MAG: hypothetical protein HY951_03105 [Bacteroidia bacterium]|nr:hypothetical protein [Bacteroidia bacterium]